MALAALLKVTLLKKLSPSFMLPLVSKLAKILALASRQH